MTPITPQSHEQMKERWKKFVNAIRTVLQAQPAQKPESSFHSVLDEALSVAEGEQMAEEVARGYTSALQSPLFQPATIVGEELSAFDQAVQGSKPEIQGAAQKPLRKKLCDAAKTILGSVKEVFGLTEYGKAVLEVLKEAIELAGND